MLIQESDLLIAIGSRLSLQQTGFNWQEFVPNGEIVQIDCDEKELNKGHPKVDFKICADANHFFENLVNTIPEKTEYREWINHCVEIKNKNPLNEYWNNNTGEKFISPYEFYEKLSNLAIENDNVTPCSSGGAFTTFQQTFAQKKGQIITSNKGMASMGYGLSGAIGTCFVDLSKRTILIEGDGGFAQNLQELGVVKVNKLNLKIFIFSDNGYASIRMTQKNYFNGKYVGCDEQTGVGFPNWQKLFDAYDIKSMNINKGFEKDEQFLYMFNSVNPVAFIVEIDPEQTYFPKITSFIQTDGSMKSNPLHKMSPFID